MAAIDGTFERTALVRSIAVTGILGSVGVAWGLLSGSQMILLDGLYAFVGIAISWLLLRASTFAERAPTRRYPYGRQSLVPLVIGIQGFILLAMLGYAAVEAVFTILDGGTDITPGWAIAYGVLTTVGSLAFWWWLRSVSASSDLLAAEATAWQVGWARGVGMVVGFSAMAVLAGSSYDGAVPYIDPAMVLITCVAFLPAPITMVRATIPELLEGAPSSEIQEVVTAAVAEVSLRFDLEALDLYMTKVGPKLYVELEGKAAPEVTIKQEHEVRSHLLTRLEALPYDIWLTVELLPTDNSPGSL